MLISWKYITFGSIYKSYSENRTSSDRPFQWAKTIDKVITPLRIV